MGARGGHCSWPQVTCGPAASHRGPAPGLVGNAASPPGVAMVTGKQAPFWALFLAAVSEGSGQCVGA